MTPADAGDGRFTTLLVRLGRSPRARLAILAVALVGGAIAAIALGGPSKDAITDAVGSTGVAGPLVFIALYVALTVLLVPGTLLTAAGGILFGVALGTALSLVSATLAATICFLIGRRLGREHVEQIAGKRVARLDEWIARNGFAAVLYVRLIPLVPFNALNYVAGVSAVDLRSYVAATAVGIIPGTFAYTALGGSFDEPTSPEFLAAVALIVVLAVAAPLVQRVARRRGLVPGDDDGDERDA
ncbi:MAG: TVP38/TMEM64 family protein [Actinobacteria bacterium]|nr:TVP38/TMEM64 family protein [Actinomycetota bacterium]